MRQEGEAKTSHVVSKAINKTSVQKLVRVLCILQEVDRRFTLLNAICFLEIAQDEGCALVDLHKKTGFSVSTLSRVVGALSLNRQLGGDALGLVHRRRHPDDPRRWDLYLTPKGKRVLVSMEAALNA